MNMLTNKVGAVVLAEEGSESKVGLYVALAVIIVVVLVALILIIRILVRSSKKKKAEKKVDETITSSTSQLADKFGGKDNIEKIQTSMSRVVVLVKDSTIIDKEGINSVLPGSMFMGNKIVFVIGSDSEKFKKLLEENVGKIEK